MEINPDINYSKQEATQINQETELLYLISIRACLGQKNYYWAWRTFKAYKIWKTNQGIYELQQSSVGGKGDIRPDNTEGEREEQGKVRNGDQQSIYG